MSDLSFQVRAPLGLELATGDHVTIEEWSLKGFAFPGERDLLPSQGILSIPFQGVAIRFEVRFTQEEEGRFLTFDGLTGRQRETLAVFYRSILSGKMASTEEIITSLDTPVDLVPMGETEEEATEAKAKQSPRLFRVIWNVAFYLAVAMVVFGVIGGQVWSALSSVRVSQARVDAPLIAHAAPEGAYVDAIRVAVGDRVRQGETLVVLSSPEHDARLTELRDEIKGAERQVWRAEAALERHLLSRDVARALVLDAYLRAVARRQIRDFVGDYGLAEVRFAYLRLRAFDDGWSNEPGDFHDIRATLEDALRARQEALRRLKRRLGAEKSAGAAVDIVALADGIVTALPVFEDQYLTRGALAAEIEESRPRMILGWLDESLADAVYLGMAAEATANVGGTTRRVAGVVRDVSAGADPERPGVYGLLLTVEPADWAQAEGLLRPGAPVRLRLLRDWSRLDGWLEWVDART